MKVSVIVPIYKVEKYLHRCVKSLLEQTYNNFELILVDDGSPDQCPVICDEFALRDKRVKVIHKKNGGLSDARNIGLKKATGEYVLFVDSDDWVRKDYIELLVNKLEFFDADICECEVIRTSNENMEMKAIDIDAENCYSAEESIRLLIKDQVFHQYVWNKIYKKKVIDKFLFPVGKTNEDEFWSYKVFGNAKKIAKINEPLYYYFQRDDSIMGAEYSLRRLDALEAKQERQKYIDINFSTLSSDANRNLFESCI